MPSAAAPVRPLALPAATRHRAAPLAATCALLALAACRGPVASPRVTPLPAVAAARSPDAARSPGAARDAAPLVASADAAAPAPDDSDPLARGELAPEETEPSALDDLPAGATPDERDLRARCTPRPSPRLPVPPPELAPAIARFRAIARGLARCDHGVFRTPRRPDPRCAGWFAQLARGGPAAMHALGIEFATRRRLEGETDASCGSRYIGTAANKIARVLAGFGATEAMPYLLRYLAIQIPQGAFGGYDGYAVSGAYEGVTLLAARDVAPAPRHAEEEAEYWADAVRRWSLWYRAHAREPYAQWREEGLAASRAALEGADLRARLAAANVLAAFPSERGAVLAAARRAAAELAAMGPAEDDDDDDERVGRRDSLSDIESFARDRRIVPTAPRPEYVSPRWP